MTAFPGPHLPATPLIPPAFLSVQSAHHVLFNYFQEESGKRTKRAQPTCVGIVAFENPDKGVACMCEKWTEIKKQRSLRTASGTHLIKVGPTETGRAPEHTVVVSPC